MDREKLRKKTKQKIDEVNRKLLKIRNELALQSNKEINEQVSPTMIEMNQLRDEIQDLSDLIAKDRITDDMDFDKVEKNVYNNIESFNAAFKKAGSLLRIK